MAERDARVLAIGAGHLHLRLEGATCRDCSLGCGGRCSAFARVAGEYRLSGELPGARIGDRVVLQFDDDELRRVAWWGYGRALAGLVLGVAAGYGVGLLAGRAEDLLTLTGLLAGTFAAIFLSKPHAPEPRALLRQTHEHSH